MVKAYCRHCLKKVGVVSPTAELTKKGTGIVKGLCENCRGTVMTFMSKQSPDYLDIKNGKVKTQIVPQQEEEPVEEKAILQTESLPENLQKVIVRQPESYNPMVQSPAPTRPLPIYSMREPTERRRFEFPQIDFKKWLIIIALIGILVFGVLAYNGKFKADPISIPSCPTSPSCPVCPAAPSCPSVPAIPSCPTCPSMSCPDVNLHCTNST